MHDLPTVFSFCRDDRPIQTPRFDTFSTVRDNFSMAIVLAKDVEEFLQAQVRAGVCADASTLANDVLRSVREQQTRSFELTPELESWLLQAADSASTPLTSADFGGILDRARERPR